ncbi:MAG: hypothetical protein ACLTER_11335 [Ruminococcus sp.]
MRGIEPSCEIYRTILDDEKRYFYDRGIARIDDTDCITPIGKPLSAFIESDETFISRASILKRFESAGYLAESFSDLTKLLQDNGIFHYEFKIPIKIEGILYL